MGMHADMDEDILAPVVTLSLGMSGLFRFGNPEGRGRPWVDVEVESGDLIVFGGPARLAYHGVMRLLDDSDYPELFNRRGRLNVTIRQTR